MIGFMYSHSVACGHKNLPPHVSFFITHQVEGGGARVRPPVRALPRGGLRASYHPALLRGALSCWLLRLRAHVSQHQVPIAVGSAVALLPALGCRVDRAVLHLHRVRRADRTQDELCEGLVPAHDDRLVAVVANGEDAALGGIRVGTVPPIEHNGSGHDALDCTPRLGDDVRRPTGRGHEGQARRDGQRLTGLERHRELRPLLVDVAQVHGVDVVPRIVVVLAVRDLGAGRLRHGVHAEKKLLAHQGSPVRLLVGQLVRPFF